MRGKNLDGLGEKGRGQVERRTLFIFLRGQVWGKIYRPGTHLSQQS